jgi:DNA polymerase-4
MDAYFAAVEQLDHAELQGKPVLVGGTGPRGVVSTASYEARAFGCRSGQPMAAARRLCPHAIVVKPRFWRYSELSGVVSGIFSRYTPLTEPVSIDEAFLDLTGTERLLGPAQEVAARIRRDVKRETGLTCSIGVAGNKFLAKLASDLQKPDGLTIIRPGEVDRILPPLPVTRLWGIGPKSGRRLQEAGIATIGDLRRADAVLLRSLLGRDAERYLELAAGRDDRPVIADHQARSVGQECTFPEDVTDSQVLLRTLLAHAEHVGARLRRHDLRAGTVSIKVRDGRFRTITRSTTLSEPSHATTILHAAAKTLLERWMSHGFPPVRLLGMSVGRLEGADRQPILFEDREGERQQRLDRAIDRINQRFGAGVIGRAGAARNRRGQGKP